MHDAAPKLETVKRCESCASQIRGIYTRFCDPCRADRRRRHKKYFFTPKMDEAIKKAYAERQDKRISTIPNLKELAVKWDMPFHVLKKRGVQLGVARTKEKPWSEKEIAILYQYSWMCLARIRLKLKAAGFSRSETAINLKLKRLAARQKNTDYYSASGLASCFGIDSHAISRWIRTGLLKADRRGTARVSQQGGDEWVIHETAVRDFIFRNPMTFDIRKVDQLWFMDLITGGKLGS